ncbi:MULTISPECIES: helix-turn-helix transcriptional regulator [Myroides]|uniref:helix-turn-helix transcriptional regulator n=1 Tax=Myroides TaxID=76831 RepID=UPI001303E993|nr:WYL domain-containing protein [Myroides phaeus]
MAKGEYAKRQMLIVELLRKKECTLKEIQEYLINKSTFFDKNLEISSRTFQRDVKDILSLMGIEILYDRKEKVYKISEEHKEEYIERVIESYDTITALKVGETLGEHIYFEKRKTRGTEHFSGILHAIQNKLVVTFTLDSYWKDPSERRCVPKAIKESQNRYYMIAYDLDKKELRNYGLDRVSNLVITTQTAVSPVINIKKHYESAFGIECYDAPQKVVLEIDQSQRKYVESLPFHHSQKITSTSDYTFTVELFVHPTTDFVMEIMRHGSNIEIISPPVLRDWVIDTIKEMCELYELSLTTS